MLFYISLQAVCDRFADSYFHRLFRFAWLLDFRNRFDLFCHLKYLSSYNTHLRGNRIKGEKNCLSAEIGLGITTNFYRRICATRQFFYIALVRIHLERKLNIEWFSIGDNLTRGHNLIYFRQNNTNSRQVILSCNNLISQKLSKMWNNTEWSIHNYWSRNGTASNVFVYHNTRCMLGAAP